MILKNIKIIFFILKEIILFVKYVVDEWEKLEKDGESKVQILE